MFWNSRLLIAQVTAGTVVNTTAEDMAKDMADTAASALTEDTSATVIQDTLDTIKAMEITEATLDIIENLVNIVTHTKCIDCINHIKVKTVWISLRLSRFYIILFSSVERNSIIFQVMQIARVDLNKKKKMKIIINKLTIFYVQYFFIVPLISVVVLGSWSRIHIIVRIYT